MARPGVLHLNAPALPALALTLVLAVAAAIATGPSEPHDHHHPPEMAGTERAFASVAQALAKKWGYPR
jgi:hypothetical protein